MRLLLIAFFLGVVALFTAPPVSACSLCGGYAAKFPFVSDYWSAHTVVCGTLANPKLDGTSGAGTTELIIDKVLKGDARLKDVGKVTLPRYLTVLNPKDPPRFIALFNDKLAFAGGRTEYTPAFLEFLLQSEAVKGKPRTQALAHFATYLDNADPAVADDAFLIFAQANDLQVREAARALKPDVFRKLVKDARLEPERLSLFAFLLGATGTGTDADLLAPLLQKPDDRTAKALEGILSGYIMRRPKEGWAWTYAVLGDARQSFVVRWGTVRAVRFLYSADPEKNRAAVLHAFALMIPHGELGDVAVSDLQKWQLWEHTGLILKQYGRPSHMAPIVRNAILRYALTCPRPEARRFVEERRRAEPQTIRELEDDLAFERGR